MVEYRETGGESLVEREIDDPVHRMFHISFFNHHIGTGSRG